MPVMLVIAVGSITELYSSLLDCEKVKSRCGIILAGVWLDNSSPDLWKALIFENEQKLYNIL